MALTNDSLLAERMGQLRTHGITRDPVQMTDGNHGAWYYQQVSLGFNFRITDILAALGCSQIQRLDDYVARRHVLAERYDLLLSDLPLLLPYRASVAYSAFHLYVIQVDPLRAPIDRQTLFDRLREAGIGVNVHYIPVHTQPYYQAYGFCAGDFPVAEHYYANAVSLPLYPTMTEAQQDTVVDALKAALA